MLRNGVLDDVLSRIRDLPGWTPALVDKLEGKWRAKLRTAPPLVAHGTQREAAAESPHASLKDHQLATTANERPSPTWPGAEADSFMASGPSFFGPDARMVAAYARGDFADLASAGPLQLQGTADLDTRAPEPPALDDRASDGPAADDTLDLNIDPEDLKPVQEPHESARARSPSRKRKRSLQDVQMSLAREPDEQDGGHSGSDSDYGEEEQQRRKRVRRSRAAENSEEHRRHMAALEEDASVLETLRPLKVAAKLDRLDAAMVSGWVKRLKTSTDPSGDAVWRLDLQGAFVRMNNSEVFLPSCHCELTFGSET